MTTFVIDSLGRPLIDKDPDATLDFSFDWGDWLDVVSDSIVSANVTTTDADVTIEDFDVLGGSIVRVWVSGGTVGTTVPILCRITTASSPIARIDDRTMYLKIVER